MKKIIVLILARGGSKGIPNKNAIDFCGKPLLVWSIEQAKQVESISSIWVSSDSQDILKIASACGVNTIQRPKEISEDTSSSESGWIHAINEIKTKGLDIDFVVALQPTSPIRESADIEHGINEFQNKNYDSLFSCATLRDFTMWKNENGVYNSINFDYKNRLRRQDMSDQYILENGSLYIFKPEILLAHNNRLGGEIGTLMMPMWKSFEIDDLESFKLCETIMKQYLLRTNSNYLESLFSMQNKIALVTGAARGNGKAISEALLRAGATVVLVDMLKEDLENTSKTFKDHNLDAHSYTCDITNYSLIIELKNYITTTFGRIDVLVNNAGVTYSHDALDYPDEYWEKTYQVNLKAPFNLAKELGKIMKEQKSGVIINITTIGAKLGFPDNPAYGAFKAGLRHLTKMLALDFGKYGIRVNNIAPGYMKTNMTKKSWDDPVLRKNRTDRTILGRWGEPSDLAGAVLYLSSSASTYVTGQDLYVDGGWSIKGL
jgi:NAD(P)-dependent dehydrogenase (short-subunit alcohol dehydrogenase family)/CMP-N-acetylneuraminic acid synthetase